MQITHFTRPSGQLSTRRKGKEAESKVCETEKPPARQVEEQVLLVEKSTSSKLS